MHYPIIDPIIFSIGPIALRWYGLMYLLGFAAVYWLGARRMHTHPGNWDSEQISDLVFYGALGAVLGGRVGYVIFYNFSNFLADPLYLFRVWEGGMSFHGGFLGVLVALLLFASKTNRHFLQVTDFIAPLCPIGLGLGRMGNFINMELPGRVTDSAFGIIFHCDAVRGLRALCLGSWESVARHPSSLYQAFTEGLLLFCLLWFVSIKPRPMGHISGLFLVGYGSFRFITEFFRSPDSHIGFVLLDAFSMGQLLSLPMIIAGVLLILWARRRNLVAMT
jgi:phosphatidylglycerol:prolipoprotein diacylglycerol transferase